jgi:hypothetical protein
LAKFIENGSVTNHFKSLPTKDNFSSNFAEDFDVIFFHNIGISLLKKGMLNYSMSCSCS